MRSVDFQLTQVKQFYNDNRTVISEPHSLARHMSKCHLAELRIGSDSASYFTILNLKWTIGLFSFSERQTTFECVDVTVAFSFWLWSSDFDARTRPRSPQGVSPDQNETNGVCWSKHWKAQPKLYTQSDVWFCDLMTLILDLAIDILYLLTKKWSF